MEAWHGGPNRQPSKVWGAGGWLRTDLRGCLAPRARLSGVPGLLGLIFVLCFELVGCRPARAPGLTGGQSPSPSAQQPLGPIADAAQTDCPQERPYTGVSALPPNTSYLRDSANQTRCVASVPGFLTGTMGPALALDESQFRSMPSPNYRSRGGVPISGIVVHHTAGGFEPSIAQLRSANAACPGRELCPRVSAHVIVSRQGEVVRLVPDDMAAFHAVQANSSTLGLEIEATQDQKGLEPAQEKALVGVILFWLRKHRLDASQLSTHRSHVPTLCPSFIWPDEGIFGRWKLALGSLARSVP